MEFKITMTIEVDDDFIDFNDVEEKEWFDEDVICYKAENYNLHNNEIEDSVGKVISIDKIEQLTRH